MIILGVLGYHHLRKHPCSSMFVFFFGWRDSEIWGFHFPPTHSNIHQTSLGWLVTENWGGGRRNITNHWIYQKKHMYIPPKTTPRKNNECPLEKSGVRRCISNCIIVGDIFVLVFRVALKILHLKIDPWTRRFHNWRCHLFFGGGRWC